VLIGALALAGYLGARTLAIAWTLQTAALALGWSMVSATDASFGTVMFFGIAMLVAPGVVTLIALGSAARRIRQDWRRRDDPAAIA
jgi:uncharacterized membrane protein